MRIFLKLAYIIAVWFMALWLTFFLIRWGEGLPVLVVTCLLLLWTRAQFDLARRRGSW